MIYIYNNKSRQWNNVSFSKSSPVMERTVGHALPKEDCKEIRICAIQCLDGHGLPESETLVCVTWCHTGYPNQGSSYLTEALKNGVNSNSMEKKEINKESTNDEKYVEKEDDKKNEAGATSEHSAKDDFKKSTWKDRSNVPYYYLNVYLFHSQNFRSSNIFTDDCQIIPLYFIPFGLHYSKFCCVVIGL
ncbi:hypothetical protein RFI_07257 [Reticulomyxa filosa]|uniref:Uncharacterized protein n=1 Tax=Reticulomyxa filosa TaxID=46433 RepID=X6NX81_RETFI|nr:hypothetical protein RFI_07257 [Reticulomyxa filosa]|eukprot:ETO29867.1 hypothetical protein RFI_07257 [Reticulomyxa filosa]